MSNFSLYIAMWAGRLAAAFVALLVLGLVVVSCAMDPAIAAGTKSSTSERGVDIAFLAR